MKKILLSTLLILTFGLSACLFEMDITVNEPVDFSIPVTTIPLPIGFATNVVAETGVSNQGKGIFGDYATVKELRVDYTLTNKTNNTVIVSLGLTAVSPVTNGGSRITEIQTYHTNGQTAWFVTNITLSNYASYQQLYVSGDVDPLFRDILIQSNSYQLVIQTYVSNTNTVISTNVLAVDFTGTLSLDVQRQQQDMPAIVSLFQ